MIYIDKSEQIKNKLQSQASIKDCMVLLQKEGNYLPIYIIDNNDNLVGTVTDGDIRRGLISNILDIESPITSIMNNKPIKIILGNFDPYEVYKLREERNDLKSIPICDSSGELVSQIIFKERLNLLNVEVVIMAGGKGKRLLPLTKSTPKPLIHVGDKPIIEHNIDNLSKFGYTNFTISLGYLGVQIQNYFQKGERKKLAFKYLNEDSPMGTFGVLGKVNNHGSEDVLITNSDLFTDLDYEDFYFKFKQSNSDLQVLSISRNYNIPFGVFTTQDENILGIKEKPTNHFLINGGIYLIKRKLLSLIPPNQKLDAPDFIKELISKEYKVTHYPFQGRWLDVGTHEELEKARELFRKK